jgi:hypothetical protein
MRFLVFAVLSLAVLASTASAQTSAFVSITATDYGFSPSGSNVFYTPGDEAGFIAGVFQNFHKNSRLTLGMDERFSYSPGTQGGAYDAVDFRLGLVPDRNLLRPYFQTGLGVIHSAGSSQSMYSFPVGHYTQFAEEFLVGLDIKLTDSFDLRAIELGGVEGVSCCTTVSTGIVSAGLVYHLHPLGRTRKP